MNVKNDNISKLQFDEFLRAIGISKNDTFSLLLGAGCSINSDIPSAEDCIWEWKRDIYKTNNPSVLGWIDNYKNKKSQTIIQNWLDNQGIYPEKNTKEAKAVCRQIGEILKFAKISELSPEDHDEMIGFVSQLTHCIAMSLMTCDHTENLEDYTGDSFRDLTRIARIDETMWSELFLLNKDALLHQMKLFTMELSKLERMLMEADKEGIKDMMRRSTARRKLFDKEPPATKEKEE